MGKYIRSRLLIMPVIGILVGINLGNFFPPQAIPTPSTEAAINPITTSVWITAARDDRQRECLALGICDA